ncbi:MAG: ABC transporter permease subunit [Treponema sp.]|nr:ABC transporter permease subunit [Treponema sp.]
MFSFIKLMPRIKQNAGLYLLLLPAVILLVLFAYKPMYGVVIAFKDYRNALGIMGSPWSSPWYANFTKFFNSFQFGNTLRNTLGLSVYGLVASFPLPIVLALALNQMRTGPFKRMFQTITYLPHFISTVVMVGLILIVLSPGSGLIGQIFKLFGKVPPNLMGSASAFSSIYVWSDVWQHTGWDSIVYLAALSAIDPSLYEAATIDGASKLQKLNKIDLPLILPTASILLILRVGNTMNIGFEKVYLMQNNLNMSSSEIIATYVYKIGLINAQYSYSAAINLFNTIINLTLLILVNQITKKLSSSSLF